MPASSQKKKKPQRKISEKSMKKHIAISRKISRVCGEYPLAGEMWHHLARNGAALDMKKS